MFKTWKTVSLAVAFIFAITFLPASSVLAEKELLTKGKLAELIISNSSLELPEGAEKLSKEEYAEVMFNMLSSNGLNMFAGANYDDPVSYDEFMTALFVISGGDTTLSADEQMKYLADHGYIPPDFLIVETVRSGIQEFYDNNNNQWPVTLDDAQNGIASADNLFFTTVLATAIDDAWQKNDFFYTAPSTGIVYTYEPETGRFQANANVDLDFAIEVMGGIEAFTPERPEGDPDDDKEFNDA